MSETSGEAPTEAAERPKERLVGLKELIELFGTERQTVYAWRTRKLLPEPDYVVSETPIWRLETIEKWAAETRRRKRIHKPTLARFRGDG